MRKTPNNTATKMTQLGLLRVILREQINNSTQFKGKMSIQYYSQIKPVLCDP